MIIQQLNSWATVYLTSSRNWNDWFSVVKFNDLTYKIWNYVNFDNLKDSIFSTDSSSFAVFQIKADATIILDLENDKFSCYSYLCKMWKKKSIKKLSKILYFFVIIFISLSMSVWSVISSKMRIFSIK